jgi:hypothetical protein
LKVLSAVQEGCTSIHLSLSVFSMCQQKPCLLASQKDKPGMPHHRSSHLVVIADKLELPPLARVGVHGRLAGSTLAGGLLKQCAVAAGLILCCFCASYRAAKCRIE